MSSPGPAARGRHRTENLFWLAAYLAMLAGVIVLVLHARSTTLREMDTPEAHAQWQQWRDAEPNQSESGPVRRRPPSADEPPALLLMRDHFAVVMSGSVIFSSLLFAAIMMAVRGAFSRSHGGNAD
ncbi:MAG TPA: hypothetical protein VGZ26_00130 [Pirellulales bacterium]|jgi:hypothetical protein|nr:hypothetical protein [Pirellulales bacterium]